MRLMIVMLAALICASCGGGPPSASSAMNPSTTSAMADSSMPPAPVSDPSAGSPSMTTPPSNPSSAGSSSPPASSPPLYEVVEIPRLTPTGSVTANGVNDQGVIVGEQETTAASRAWMYAQSSGALMELTLAPTEDGALASAISDSGVIAGAELGPPAPGFWTVTGGSMLLTGQYVAFAQAVAVDDAGVLVGDYQNSGTLSSLPLVWTPPGYAETSLPGLECDNCNRTYGDATAINNAGVIVGSSSYNTAAAGGGTHAVEWQAGNIVDLGGLDGANSSAAYSINTGGDIAGSSRTSAAAGAPTHAVLFSQGVITDLGILTGDLNSSANSINDLGQIVGVSSNDVDTSRAFLYQNGHMYDPNSLIDPASAFTGRVSLHEAVGISGNGLIAVNGTDSQDPGWTRAFLLIPAP